MDWIKTINQAIACMEDHLTDGITLADIAKHVHLSAFPQGVFPADGYVPGGIPAEKAPFPGRGGPDERGRKSHRRGDEVRL